MKRSAINFLTVGGIFVGSWAFGAFISLEPNPLAWSEFGRLSYLCVSGWAAAMAVIVR